MKSILRGAAGQRGGKCRRAGLEVRARAEYRIRVDHGSGVAPGDVLAEARLVPGLVVDAGVGGDDLHAPQALDELALLRHPGGVLPPPLAVAALAAARAPRAAAAAARPAAHFLAHDPAGA